MLLLVTGLNIIVIQDRNDISFFSFKITFDIKNTFFIHFICCCHVFYSTFAPSMYRYDVIYDVIST